MTKSKLAEAAKEYGEEVRSHFAEDDVLKLQDFLPIVERTFENAAQWYERSLEGESDILKAFNKSQELNIMLVDKIERLRKALELADKLYADDKQRTEVIREALKEQK
jgi:hypothetical protein